MNSMSTNNIYFNSQDTAEDCNLGEQIVLSALQNTLDLSVEEKMAVMEALQLSPELVRTESKPLQFLKVEKYDAAKAAKRLANYWNFRKQIFGDQAFQPLTLLGDGAMESSDIEAFKKCYYMPLPEDAMGRSVVFLDKRKFHDFSPVIKSRCGFYMCQVASESDGSVTKGFRMITMVDEIKFSNNAKEFVSFIKNAFPVEFISSHMVQLTESDPDYQTLADYAAYMAMFFGYGIESFYHTGSTPEELKVKLVPHGFLEDGLPACCGGPWGPQKIATWMTERMQLEYLRRSERNNRFGPLQQQLLLQAYPNSINDMIAFRNFNQSTTSYASLPNAQLPVGPRAEIMPALLGNNLGTNLSSLASLRNSDGITNNAIGRAYFGNAAGNNQFTLQGLQATSNLSGLNQSAGMMRSGHGINSNPLHLFVAPPTGIAQHNAIGSTFAQVENGSVQSNTGSSQVETPAAMEDKKMPAKPTKGPFEEALDSIAIEYKHAYLEALQKSPHLIPTESDPKRFMAVENNNALSAARRFVTYWKIRKELFSERAFLPMIQTGTGALDRQDIVNLGAGSNAILPDDKNGCPVLISDRSRRLDDGDQMNIESRSRILFYVLNVLSERNISQRKGIVLISMVVTQRVVDMDLDVENKRVEIMKALPIKIKVLHMVVCPPRSSRRHMVDRIISLAVHVGEQLLGKRAILHMNETPESMLEILKGYGFNSTDLPASVGGTWKYEEFTRWMKQRAQLEGETHQSSMDNQSVGLDSSINKMDETEEERQERKRRLNIIFSRQKRERRKAEVDDLESTRDNLTSENERLKHENDILEKHLKEAQDKINRLKKGLED